MHIRADNPDNVIHFSSAAYPPVWYFGHFVAVSSNRTIVRRRKQIMKRLILVCIFVSGLALAQDRPRVFVQGKGSEDVATTGSGVGGRHWATWGAKSAIDSHDESMEVTKDLQKNCSGVIVTLNQGNADYTVMLNRESKQNRGLLRTNSQVQVANRLGDVLGTSATRTVGNAAKDACQLVLADWSQHGRAVVSESPAPTPAPAVARVAPAVASTTTGGAKLETVSAFETQPATVAASTATSSTTDQGDGSLGDTAKRAKQHKACLELAKDNPSVVCK
jgi:hypothetical protein